MMMTITIPTLAGAEEMRERHRWLGMASLPVMGLQIGLGMGLRAQEPNPAISLRGAHMASSLALVGFSLLHLNDALKAGEPKPTTKLHRWLGYSHMALLLLAGAAGVLRARAWDRSADEAKTMGQVHTALGLAAAGTLFGAAFTFDWK